MNMITKGEWYCPLKGATSCAFVFFPRRAAAIRTYIYFYVPCQATFRMLSMCVAPLCQLVHTIALPVWNVDVLSPYFMRESET
jgi:hypothetical protein